jgi:two-component system, cell cycle response regulator
MPSGRVLLIDDDRLQATLVGGIVRGFRSPPYALEWAATYDEGLERLASGEYAACLLDYQLGPRDGLELLREAAARGCRTPIIFLTAEASETVDLQAVEAGALDYLLKGELTPGLLERSLRYAVKLGATLESLRELAVRDELTGLPNRRAFEAALAEELERARRFGREFGLVLADVDRFKDVNDREGHEAGDGVLREVARRLRGATRTVDRLARFGGDEVALLLPETNGVEAAAVARRVVECIGREPFPGGRAVTLSVGVAVYPLDGADRESLFSAADRALYAAKRAGRNRACAANTSGPSV